MAFLVTLQGPDTGRKFNLQNPRTLVGRQFDSTICFATGFMLSSGFVFLSRPARGQSHSRITLPQFPELITAKASAKSGCRKTSPVRGAR